MLLKFLMLLLILLWEPDGNEICHFHNPVKFPTDCVELFLYFIIVPSVPHQFPTYSLCISRHIHRFRLYTYEKVSTGVYEFRPRRRRRTSSQSSDQKHISIENFGSSGKWITSNRWKRNQNLWVLAQHFSYFSAGNKFDVSEFSHITHENVWLLSILTDSVCYFRAHTMMGGEMKPSHVKWILFL